MTGSPALKVSGERITRLFPCFLKRMKSASHHRIIRELSDITEMLESEVIPVLSIFLQLKVKMTSLNPCGCRTPLVQSLSQSW